MKKALSSLTLAAGVLFFFALLIHLYDALQWGHDRWDLSEWLINYSGGFVRRGLLGEIVFHFAALTGIRADYVVYALSYAFYLPVVAFFFKRGRGWYPPYVLLSCVSVGQLAYIECIVRKDALLVLLMIACLMVQEQKWSDVKKIALVNLISVFAILAHEAFFFFAVPVLIVLNRKITAPRLLPTLGSLLVGAFQFLPTIAAFASSVVFHGNTEIATAINDSWRDLWLQTGPSTANIYIPDQAIAAVAWDTQKALSLSAGVFQTFSFGVYVPLGWLFSMIVCFVCTIRFLGVGPGDPAQPRGVPEQPAVSPPARMTVILAFQLVCIVPLFIVGFDFGRWIFFWITSSLAIFLMRLDLDRHIPSAVFRLSDAAIRPLLAKVRINPWLLLAFGMPLCCWKPPQILTHSPLGWSIKFVVDHTILAGKTTAACDGCKPQN